MTALDAADAVLARIRTTRTEQVKDHRAAALALAVAANLPVLLWGEPGVGKSATLAQLAEVLGAPMETVIASVHEPSDFAGLPIVGEDSAVQGVPMAPPDWAVRLSRYKSGILFFDELSSAPPAVQAALLRVVLTARPGLTHHLPTDAEARGGARPSPRTWDMTLRLLTDGFTPWPATTLGQTRVIAGLVGAEAPEPPSWIKSIHIPTSF